MTRKLDKICETYVKLCSGVSMETLKKYVLWHGKEEKKKIGGMGTFFNLCRSL